MASENASPKPLYDKPTPEQTYYDRTILLLQGGGALGAYQAGAYEALASAEYESDWVAGISIGAINAALIVGNPPELRVERLRCFWQRITRTLKWPAPRGDWPRSLFNSLSSLNVMAFGLPDFFQPRLPAPFLRPRGARGATSFYDTAPLLETLNELVDFDRINNGDLRLTLSAVDVESGAFVCFDNTECTITPEHVLASSSLPPGFPATEIDGRLYWDGGVVSNSPLNYVLRQIPKSSHVLIFQIDLWEAYGNAPRNLFEVEARHKDVTYSSRTQMSIDLFQREFQLREAIAELAERLPKNVQEDPDIAPIINLGHRRSITLGHLIYKKKPVEDQARDYEFSRASMLEHWQAGRKDTQHGLVNPEWHQPDSNHQDGIRVFYMS